MIEPFFTAYAKVAGGVLKPVPLRPVSCIAYLNLAFYIFHLNLICIIGFLLVLQGCEDFCFTYPS